MRAIRLVDAMALALGAWIAGLVAVTWAGRLPYPYDLEWMEGGMLAHAWRLQHGLPLYTQPDATWVPYVYPPGYPAVVAALGLPLGLTMGLGRAVSVAGTLAACAALVFAGWRQGSAVAGLLGASLFLACYPDSGAFYDLVRPDALAIGIAGWAVVLGLEASPRARDGAALLLAASFLVKHNLAALGPAMALGIGVAHGWRASLRFGLLAALPALACAIGLEVASAERVPVGAVALLLPIPVVAAGTGIRWGRDRAVPAAGIAALALGTGSLMLLRDIGHFQRTILGIPGAHPMVGGRMLPGALEEVSASLGIALVLATGGLLAGTLRLAGPRWPVVAGLSAVGALIATSGTALETVAGVGRSPAALELAGWVCLGTWAGCAVGGLVARAPGRGLDGRWVYGVGVLGTLAVVAGLMRAHHGGFLNVFIPLHWGIGLAVAAVLAHSRRCWPSPMVGAGGSLLVAAQLAMKLELAPARYVPDERDRQAGDAFVDALQDCDGPIFSPYAAWLPVYVGQAPSTHLIAIWDVNHEDSPYRSAIRDLGAAAEARAWACVVDGNGKPLGYGIQKAYRVDRVPMVPRRPETDRPQTFMPRTGWRVRPAKILVPRESP